MVRRLIFIALAIVLVVAGGYAVWFSVTKGGLVKPPAQQLPSVEIRQYEGKNLSSVNDFRENSIKAPSTSISVPTSSKSAGWSISQRVSPTTRLSTTTKATRNWCV